MMSYLLLMASITSNPTITIVVDDWQSKSKFAVADFSRDYSQINPKTNLTPRQLTQHHARVRRLNYIRSNIKANIVFVKSDTVEPLREYPQYKTNNGDWHPFPKQAFYSNGWFMLTVARIADEWTYGERLKRYRPEARKEYSDLHIHWKGVMKEFLAQRVAIESVLIDNPDKLKPDHPDYKKTKVFLAKECIKELDNVWLDCEYYDHGLDDDDIPCGEGNIDWATRSLQDVYSKYKPLIPDLPFMLMYCYAPPQKTYLPYEFDIYKHEGFKLKTEESFGEDN